jgi:hypothetical protein
MFRRIFQVSALLAAAILTALPAAASTLTSSNSADAIGFASGSNFNTLEWSGSPPTWYGSVTSEVSAGGFSSATTIQLAGGSGSVSGANGLAGGNIQGFSSTPMIITAPNGDTALTAIALLLGTAGSGTTTIQITLSDGSTVSATSSGTNWVSFVSPIGITSIQLSGGGSGFMLEDVESGSAVGADLPTQPDDSGSGGSSAPEAASMLLTGGGLVVLSRFLRQRCHS